MFEPLPCTGFGGLGGGGHQTGLLRPCADRQYLSDPLLLRRPAAIVGNEQQQRQPHCPTTTRSPELPRGRLLPAGRHRRAGRCTARRLVATVGAAAGYHRRSAGHPAGTSPVAAAATRAAAPRRQRAAQAMPLPGLAPGQRQPKGVPQRRQPCSRATRSYPSRPQQRSPTRRRASRASTRSPAASSISMRISARPCSSARCG